MLETTQTNDTATTNGAGSPKHSLKYGELYIYLSFVSLLLAKTLDPIAPFQLNLSQLFLGFLTLIHLPLIARAKTNRVNAITLFIIVIIAISPIFYLALDLLDETRLIATHTAVNKFISYSSYSVHALAIYVCISTLNITIWNKINKYIFYLGVVISFEAIIFYYIFPDLIPRDLIAPKGKFESLILHNNVLCGIVATILYPQSVIVF